jgi:hypothetical protein
LREHASSIRLFLQLQTLVEADDISTRVARLGDLCFVMFQSIISISQFNFLFNDLQNDATTFVRVSNSLIFPAVVQRRSRKIAACKLSVGKFCLIAYFIPSFCIETIIHSSFKDGFANVVMSELIFHF